MNENVSGFQNEECVCWVSTVKVKSIKASQNVVDLPCRYTQYSHKHTCTHTPGSIPRASVEQYCSTDDEKNKMVSLQTWSVQHSLQTETQ